MKNGIALTTGIMMISIITLILTWGTYLYSKYYFADIVLLVTMIISWLSITTFIFAMMDDDEFDENENTKGKE